MLPQKQWYDSSTADPEQVKQLCREWNTNQYVAEILLRRGYKTCEEIKSFLIPELKNLRDPYELRQMREAVNLLQETIAGNRRIVILGDYDVDGITATALMLDFLNKCGKLDLDFFYSEPYQARLWFDGSKYRYFAGNETGTGHYCG